MAIRIGELTDSSLGARRLHTPRWVMLASPGYLARHGVPTDPGALSRHNCLRYATASGAPHPWTVAIGAQEAPVRVEVEGNLVVDDGQAILEAAVAGMGICQVLDFMGTEHIRAGRLVEVLAPHTAPGPPVHALFAARRNREANVRVCLDFLAELFAELGGSAQKA